MGIKQLAKLISDYAPRAHREQDVKAFFGRRIALDASMSIYQFLVAVRTADSANLTNEAGEVTSHLSGVFYRTIKLLELGIKPVYVFDGKPPEMKASELAKRRARRAEDEAAAAQAKEEGDAERFAKYARRVNKVTDETMQSVKRLLRLMGMPVIEAPAEAEAQCAALATADLVYASASEDMDALTFGTPILIRNLFGSLSSAAEKKARKPSEFYLQLALEDLGVSMPQFIDVCILCGCDYTSTIPKIGPRTALNLVKQHGDIEGVLRHLKSTKHVVPDDFDPAGARHIFQHPQVLPAEQVAPLLEWRAPDEEGIVQFLVKENNFNESMVRKAIERMQKASRSGAANQSRLDAFFKATPAHARPVDEKTRVGRPLKQAKR